MVKFFKVSLVCLVVVHALTGCSIMPGMKLDEKESVSIGLSGVTTDEASPKQSVDFVSLNATLTDIDETQQAPIPNNLLAVMPPAYTLGVNDAIQLIVWNHPEISSPLGQLGNAVGGAADNRRRINESGDIFIPYAGELKVAGLTIKEARQLIAESLQDYIQDPQVDINVVEHASKRVSVTGQVQRPSSVPISTKPLHLLNAIALSGGFTDIANQRSVVLTRNDVSIKLDLVGANQSGIDLSQLYLLDGDQIYVSDNSNEKVYVLGEVTKSQPVIIGPNGMTLMQAIGEVGGINQTFGDASEVYVLRQNNPSSSYIASVYHLDASSPVSLITADNFPLQSRDIIYVGTLGVTRFNRIIGQILPSFGLYRSIELLRADID